MVPRKRNAQSEEAVSGMKQAIKRNDKKSLLACPRCGSRQGLLSLRNQYECQTCHARLRTNSMSLGIVGMALAFIPTFLLPTSGWNFLSELLAYLVVGVLIVAVLSPFVRISLDGESE